MPYLQSAALTQPAGGAQPPAVRTTARPYTAGRPTFLVAAVRKSASEAPDIVRSQPRTASLLSGNSVLRSNFIWKRAGRLAAAGFCVSAWLALVFRRGRLRCSGVICNPLEHGSVIALDCKSCERGTGGILDERKTRIAATDRLTVNYRNHDGVRCGARTHDT